MPCPASNPSFHFKGNHYGDFHIMSYFAWFCISCGRMMQHFCVWSFPAQLYACGILSHFVSYKCFNSFSFLCSVELYKHPQFMDIWIPSGFLLLHIILIWTLQHVGLSAHQHTLVLDICHVCKGWDIVYIQVCSRLKRKSILWLSNLPTGYKGVIALHSHHA